MRSFGNRGSLIIYGLSTIGCAFMSLIRKLKLICEMAEMDALSGFESPERTSKTNSLVNFRKESAAEKLYRKRAQVLRRRLWRAHFVHQIRQHANSISIIAVTFALGSNALKEYFSEHL